MSTRCTIAYARLAGGRTYYLYTEAWDGDKGPVYLTTEVPGVEITLAIPREAWTKLLDALKGQTNG